MGIDAYQLREGLLFLIILICSLALHEWGHAYVADKLGDPLPRAQGRVTLNPLVHIDPIGTLLIPAVCIFGLFGGFALIGWAKPVYTIGTYYKNRTRDSALVTIAGPAMNLLLALAATLAAAVSHHLAVDVLAAFCAKMLLANVALFVLNMLPVPPLDGSKFLMYWFGMKEETYAAFARYGWIALLLFINVPACQDLFIKLIGLVYLPYKILGAALGVPL